MATSCSYLDNFIPYPFPPLAVSRQATLVGAVPSSSGVQISIFPMWWMTCIPFPVTKSRCHRGWLDGWRYFQLFCQSYFCYTYLGMKRITNGDFWRNQICVTIRAVKGKYKDKSKELEKMKGKKAISMILASTTMIGLLAWCAWGGRWGYRLSGNLGRWNRNQSGMCHYRIGEQMD